MAGARLSKLLLSEVVAPPDHVPSGAPAHQGELHNLANRQVARRCACRAFLAADPADPADVERAVSEHRLELRHQAYAAGEQLAGRFVARHELTIGGVPLPRLRRVW